MRKYNIDLLKGQKFGRLTILDEVEKDNRRYCICKCDCGNICEIKLVNIMNNWTRSCGCLKKEYNTQNAKKMGLKNRKEMFCKICGNKHYARGLCKNCYERDRRGKVNTHIV